MFAIIITEKGGTERREVFDQTEINVGRVQNNELVLPKGNVSKHHARLLYRDGRFIVSDLKSTNGTYVNGRKIMQATIVREGDKIYVGDFILRIELAAQQDVNDGLTDAPIEEAVPESIGGRNRMSMRGSGSLSPPTGHRQSDKSQSKLPLAGDELSWSSSSPNIAIASNMPLPARVPVQASQVASPVVSGRVSPDSSTSFQAFSPPMPDRISSQLPHTSSPAPFDVTGTGSNSISVPPQRLAAHAILSRFEHTDLLASLDEGKPPSQQVMSQVDKALRDTAGSLRAAKAISDEVELEACVREAREELLGLGIIGALLNDKSVQQIQVRRYNWVTTVRAAGIKQNEYPLANEASLQRIIRRLCSSESVPTAQTSGLIQCQLRKHNALMAAIVEPLARTGAMLTLKKLALTNPSNEDLIRTGTFSRPALSFMTSCMAGGVNTFISMGPGVDTRAVISSVLSLVSPEQHVLVLHDSTTKPLLNNNATSIMSDSPEQVAVMVSASVQLNPDLLFVAPCNGMVASALLSSISAGVQGVVAFVQAPSLRHSFARLVPQIMNAQYGSTLESVREWISASFDIGVELVRLRDGRVRVAKIAELASVEGASIALRDIFNFTIDRVGTDGMIEGSFHPSGVIPRVVEQLQSRGICTDSSLFRR